MTNYNTGFNGSNLNLVSTPSAQDEMSQDEFWSLFEWCSTEEGEHAYWPPFAHGLQQGNEATDLLDPTRSVISEAQPSSYEPTAFIGARQPIAADGAVMSRSANSAVCTRTPSCKKTFTRQADLQRHIDTVHDLKEQHWCHVKGCCRAETNGNKPFPRKDKRDDHIRKMHKM